MLEHGVQFHSIDSTNRQCRVSFLRVRRFNLGILAVIGVELGSVDAPEGVVKRCVQVAVCRVSGIRLRERSAEESLADEYCSS